MKHALITTLNKKLYDSYAHRLIDSYIETKQLIPMFIFVEDNIKNYPNLSEKITYIQLIEKEIQLKNFVERNKNRLINNFFEDAVRFSYKVFAQSAAREYAEKIYYVDSDSVFIKQIPMSWYEECLPDNTFLSFYDRPKQYTETGFLAFNSKNKLCDAFFEIYKEYYIQDTVYTIFRMNKPFWTDCHTLDETRKCFLNNKDYIEKKLGDGNSSHIMARDKFINPYIDHRKGNRKKQIHSPEWLLHRSKHGER